MIRFIITLFLFFPVNGTVSSFADTICVCENGVSSFSYDQEDFFVNADELACVEEVQEDEGIVLVASDYWIKKFNQVVVLPEPGCHGHMKALKVKAYFYTNLPPPGGAA